MFQEFVNKGLAQDIKNIEVENATYGDGDVVCLFNRAPHLPIADERFAGPLGVKYSDPTQEDFLGKVGETQEYLIKLVGDI